MWQRNVAVSIQPLPCSHCVLRARFTVALLSLLAVHYPPQSVYRTVIKLARFCPAFSGSVFLLLRQLPDFFILFLSVNMEMYHG